MPQAPQTAPARHWLTTLCISSFLIVGALTAPALGQAGEPVDAAAEANSFDQQGREHYSAGRFQQAYDAFEGAHRFVPKPNYLYNMSRCLEKLARYAEAIALLERFLEAHRQQSGQDAPNKADVDNQIRMLRQRAFETLPEILIGSSPQGAVIILLPERSTLGTTPLTTHMRAGVYKLRLELPDHDALETDLVVPESGRVRAVFALTPKVRVGAISFWCNIRQVKIAVDGKVVAMTPFSGRINVPPGRHQVSLSRDGYSTIEEIVEVPEHRELHLDYELELTESPASWRAWIGWPLAVVGLGGVGGGVAAGMQADEAYRGTPTFNQWSGWQTTGYGAGGGTLALGLALIIWDGVRENIPVEDLAPGAQRPTGRKLLTLTGDGAGDMK
jgi:hypothetical protein